jgi:hypothetical protein
MNFRIWDLEAPWSLGPDGTSRGQDPDWGSGLRAGSRIWDPETS